MLVLSGMGKRRRKIGSECLHKDIILPVRISRAVCGNSLHARNGVRFEHYRGVHVLRLSCGDFLKVLVYLTLCGHIVLQETDRVLDVAEALLAQRIRRAGSRSTTKLWIGRIALFARKGPESIERRVEWSGLRLAPDILEGHVDDRLPRLNKAGTCRGMKQLTSVVLTWGTYVMIKPVTSSFGCLPRSFCLLMASVKASSLS